MKKIALFIITLLLVFGNTSCSDFLDKEVDLSLTEENVFSSVENTRRFLANVYSNLPDPFHGIRRDAQFRGAFHDLMTNNAISYWNVHRYHSVLTDGYSAADHWFAIDYWPRHFRGIRAANQLMKNARVSVLGNTVTNDDNSQLYDRYMAEARLLRAIFHFEATCWFGPIPIIGDDEEGIPIVLGSDETEKMNMSRVPVADVLKWIADECDAVKNTLPYRYTNEAENWGRVNGATAYALKSRALLYRASPLNNPTNDITLWQQAATAATDLIQKNSNEPFNYKLYRTADDDINRNYYECFIVTPFLNDEFILTSFVRLMNSIETEMSPPGFQGAATGVGRANPTQNLVDSYETLNGLPIDEDPSYDEQNPYVNRDPRFSQTILHHGAIWGDPVQEEERPIDVSYPNGRDFQSLHGGTYTGYYPKKYVNNMSFKVPVNYLHAFPIFRYGEVLLNAAEAINEAYGPSDAYQYVNEVRARVGMPPYGGMTQEQLRERIRNERRVELCFEDHWWFDERRWKLFENQTMESEKSLPRYKQCYNIYGVRVTPGEDIVYNYGPAQLHPKRTLLSPKSYYFPIPDSEVKKAPNLGQNPGWELSE
ncbi:MAG TPA: RagB/SusD family nutrient uptake outer membrane protein [Petrimonas sp.]|nr:RagB/SusD family nutrient uptake outer membrane protein [Petrimonas sp.]